MKFSLFSWESGRVNRMAEGRLTGADMPAPMPTVTPRMASITRQVQELNARYFRAFDASLTTNFNADLRGTYGSANTEILQGDYTTRARTRTIAKDTPQGKATIRTFQNNVVGDDPFRLDMRFGKYVQSPKSKVQGQDASAPGQAADDSPHEKFIEDVAVNRAIEQEWEIFAQPENFTVKGDMSRMEAFRIAEASVVRDGYILMRHHDTCPFVPDGYATEWLEADRLQTQFQGKSRDGNPIRFSIEFDKQWNRKVAYWVLVKHPLDATGQSTLANIGPDTQRNALAGANNFRVRIDAGEMEVFSNLRDRAEQDLGFTELDASVQSLWRLFQYEKALTYAAIASCCKPFWIKKNFPTGMSWAATSEEMASLFDRLAGNGAPGSAPAEAGERADAAQLQQGVRNRASTETPGATLEMEYGMELMQTDPKFPIEAAHDFRQDNLRDLAVGAGISYQDISGDFQNLGFAAALMCQIPKQDYCKIRQRNFIDCVVRPIFRRWLRAKILGDTFERKYGLSLDITKLEDYVQAAKFKAKRWAFVNPLVQAQTLIIMLEAGIMAPQQVQDQLPDGVSIEDLYTMIAEAKSEQEKHGLNFENADVTKPTISHGEPGQVVPTPEDNGESAPAKKKPANPVRGESPQSTVHSPRSNGHTRRAEVMDMIAQQGDGK